MLHGGARVGGGIKSFAITHHPIDNNGLVRRPIANKKSWYFNALTIPDRTFNQMVAGSIPAPLTKDFKDLARARQHSESACGSFAGGALQRPLEYDEFRPLAVPVYDAVRGLDESRQLSRRVVCRNATRAMSKQVLAVLKAHAGCP